jgi:hypothetical protein
MGDLPTPNNDANNTGSSPKLHQKRQILPKLKEKTPPGKGKNPNSKN